TRRARRSPPRGDARVKMIESRSLDPSIPWLKSWLSTPQRRTPTRDLELADTQDALLLKRRARRRLVGAIALVLFVVIVLPIVLDQEPSPARHDLTVQIPSQDAGSFGSRVLEKLEAPKPAAEAAAPAAAPAASEPAKVDSKASEPAPAKAPEVASQAP